MPAPADRKPISDALQRRLDETLLRVPTGASGRAEVAVSNEGFAASVGTRWKKVDVTGYAGRQWGGPGWIAGARAGVTW